MRSSGVDFSGKSIQAVRGSVGVGVVSGTGNKNVGSPLIHMMKYFGGAEDANVFPEFPYNDVHQET